MRKIFEFPISKMSLHVQSLFPQYFNGCLYCQIFTETSTTILQNFDAFKSDGLKQNHDGFKRITMVFKSMAKFSHILSVSDWIFTRTTLLKWATDKP